MRQLFASKLGAHRDFVIGHSTTPCSHSEFLHEPSRIDNTMLIDDCKIDPCSR